MRSIKTDQSDYVNVVLDAIKKGKRVDRKTVLSTDNIEAHFRMRLQLMFMALQTMKKRSPQDVKAYGGKRGLEQKIAEVEKQYEHIQTALKLN